MNTLIKKSCQQIIVILAVLLLHATPLLAQTKNPSLEEVNNELIEQKKELINIAETVMLIILIGAFVFLIANLWLKWTQPQNAIVGFIAILLIYSLFTVIF